eukprot:1602460-Prymnesium_polylepis.1
MAAAGFFSFHRSTSFPLFAWPAPARHASGGDGGTSRGVRHVGCCVCERESAVGHRLQQGPLQRSRVALLDGHQLDDSLRRQRRLLVARRLAAHTTHTQSGLQRAGRGHSVGRAMRWRDCVWALQARVAPTCALSSCFCCLLAGACLRASSFSLQCSSSFSSSDSPAHAANARVRD